MAPKKSQAPSCGYICYLEVVPTIWKSYSSSSSGGCELLESSEVKRSTKSVSSSSSRGRKLLESSEVKRVKRSTKSVSSSSSRGRKLLKSGEVKRSTKSVYKDGYGKSSSGFNKACKTEEFVDKSTGRLGYKEEVKFSRTYKCDDMEEGYTHEFQSQFKFKHVSYPTSTKNRGSSTSCTKCKCNKYIDYY